MCRAQNVQVTLNLCTVSLCLLVISFGEIAFKIELVVSVYELINYLIIYLLVGLAQNAQVTLQLCAISLQSFVDFL